MRYALLGQVVLGDKIIRDGIIVVEKEKIVYAGEKKDIPIPEKIIDCGDKIIGPGFVDIHCHAGNAFSEEHEPLESVLEYMNAEGTTGVLITLYRSLGHKKTLEAIEEIKGLMKSNKSILGVHMEGPYLNPNYGAVANGETVFAVNKKEYQEIIDKEVVVQWTFSPEVDGTDLFLGDIVKAGIIPAIGHSNADVSQVRRAYENGASIVTHIFDATGCSREPLFGGTLELDFNQAAMLCDNMYYEVICDKNGYHVRYEMLNLLIRTVGIDRVAAITDFTKRGTNGDDVAYENEEKKTGLYGSGLTMRQVAANLKAHGFSVSDIFKMTSENPSKAIKMYDRIGSIEPGKNADLVITDEAFGQIQTVRRGKIV